MKFFRLLFANLGRKKIRTALTIGSFAVAFFLFGLLFAIKIALSAGEEVAGVDRLAVINKISLIQPLPEKYGRQISQVEGVRNVTHMSWFGGVYQDERNFFPQMAIQTESFREAYPEYLITDDEWRALLADKRAAIVGRKTAERFGFEVGGQVPIIGTIFGGTWEFNVVGIYEGKDEGTDETGFFFRYDYLADSLDDYDKGLVGWYVVSVENPDDAPKVAEAIDSLFINSGFETTTQTEKAFAASFAKQQGNIGLLFITIGGVVFFTLLLVSANTMATAVRERIPELAVLKTIGFTDRLILQLVLAESFIIAGIGAGSGLGLAWLLTAGGDPTGGFFPVFYIPGRAFLLGVLFAALSALIAGIVPALSAMRLRVVDALGRV